jgi:hypothetical protein
MADALGIYPGSTTPWPESASELYRPSDRHLSAKLVPAFVDRGCHVVSMTDPYGCVLRFLDRYPGSKLLNIHITIPAIIVIVIVSWTTNIITEMSSCLNLTYRFQRSQDLGLHYYFNVICKFKVCNSMN